MNCKMVIVIVIPESAMEKGVCTAFIFLLKKSSVATVIMASQCISSHISVETMKLDEHTILTYLLTQLIVTIDYA